MDDSGKQQKFSLPPKPIHVTLPPDDGINAWPYWQGADEYRVKPGTVTKWGAWEYQFKISTCGRTHWFNAWHYTNRDRLMPGMYGTIEQREVWGLCLLRRLVVSIIRSRFAEETTQEAA